MTDNPTRLLNQLVALTSNPDDIELYERGGHAEILLGSGLAIALSTSSQAALDKLATVVARATAEQRARLLREVA